MRVTVTGRRMGKTTKMVLWLKENRERRLLVFNETEKLRINREYKIDFEQMVTPFELNSDRTRGKYSSNKPVPLAVDNADLILQAMVPYQWRIEELTITGEKV